MTKKPKLKPCPFCGKNILYFGSGNKLHNVMCRSLDCYAEGPVVTSKPKAIRAWNRRK